MATALGLSLLGGELALATPTPDEHGSALTLLDRYSDGGLDLPDAIVMAMVEARGAVAFTWDFRHFRMVVLRRDTQIPLLLSESDLP